MIDITPFLHKLTPLENVGKIELGCFQSFKLFGNLKSYEIPDDLELEDVQSVGIWCRQFNVTFGYAALSTIHLEFCQRLGNNHSIQPREIRADSLKAVLVLRAH